MTASWDWLIFLMLCFLFSLCAIFWGRGCLKDSLWDRLIGVLGLAVWWNLALAAWALLGNSAFVLLLIAVAFVATPFVLILFEGVRAKRWGWDLSGLGLFALSAAVCVLILVAMRWVGL